MTTGFDLEEREYAQENKDVGKTRHWALKGSFFHLELESG